MAAAAAQGNQPAQLPSSGGAGQPGVSGDENGVDGAAGQPEGMDGDEEF